MIKPRKPKHGEVWKTKNDCVSLFVNDYDPKLVEIAEIGFKKHNCLGYINTCNYDDNGKHFNHSGEWDLVKYIGKIPTTVCEKPKKVVESKGYHKAKITKGVYGEFSKIEEEFLELKDAFEQKNKVLQLVEFTDLIGAIEGFVAKNFKETISIADLHSMSKLTRYAFESGIRK